MIFGKILNVLRVSLILLTVLSGQGIAQMRGTSDVAGVMVLCTGTGAKTVLVDADGHPIDPQPVCPDCIVSFALASDLSQIDPISRGFRPVLANWATSALAWTVLVETPPARGPPLMFG